MNNRLRKTLFEIPEDPDSVVLYLGREVTIDGETTREINRTSACAKELLSDWGMAYCTKHWFNPVFMYTMGNLPILIGFVFDEISFKSSSSEILMFKRVCISA